MKTHFYIILNFLFCSIGIAQIQNSSFENWANGEPEHWWTPNVPGFLVLIEQSADANSGMYSVRGEVKKIPFTSVNLAPLVKLGDDENMIPVDARYLSISGYFKFMPVQGDKITFAVFMFKNGELIGEGSLYIDNHLTSFEMHAANISYSTTETPDSMLLAITICGIGGTQDSSYHEGTIYLADDISLSLSPVSIVEDNLLVNTFYLEQNYPNPFNPETFIKYSIAENAHVILKVYDLIGREVTELVNELKTPGSYVVSFKADGLASGTYIYKIQAGNFSSARKFILLK